MNVSVLAVEVISLMACATSRVEGPDSIEIIKATSQRWYGGTEESGWGTNYNFKVVFDKTAGITFDTMWIDDRAYMPQLSPYELNMRKDIGPIDTISLFCRHHKSNDPANNFAETPPLADGPDFSGAALLIYRFEGKRLTYIVDSISTLPALYYP